MSETHRADVVVVGAGPAGSLAALALARAGRQVTLVDRAAFPRDKACGDGLMPDALNALASLGLADTVLCDARRLDTLRIYSPNGSAISVAGHFAVLPREVLDARLCAAAVAAGAQWLPGVRILGPVEDNDCVVGVRGARADGIPFTVAAAVTVLATGANSGPLKAFGVCERSEPTATAVRFYATIEGSCALPDCLCVSYDRSICPGYGWLFPGPGRTFNLGVGYFYDAPALPAVTNVRELMARFLDTFPPARDVAARATQVTPLRGAPLRTGLSGATLARPGLLVAGDAAGLTYSISGEGIGKAMESGMLAAEVIDEGLRADGTGNPARRAQLIADRYARLVRERFTDRFRAYAAAQRWVAHPRLLDFLAYRANRGSYVRRTIEGLVNETSNPRDILSIVGIIRSLFS